MDPHPVLVAGASSCASTARAARSLATALGVEPEPVVVPAWIDPAAALADVAVHHDATAIVVGPDLRDDTVRRLVVGAPCPVLVAPEDPRLVPDGVHEVAVALDGSEGARLALVAAADLALRTDARLRIVAVAGGPRDREEVAGHAERAAVGLDRLDVVVDVRVGDVVRQIREASRGADVLVVGSHGRGRLRRALLGSVSSALLDLPAVPVLVVPAAARRAGGTVLGVTTAAAAG